MSYIIIKSSYIEKLAEKVIENIHNHRLEKKEKLLAEIQQKNKTSLFRGKRKMTRQEIEDDFDSYENMFVEVTGMKSQVVAEQLMVLCKHSDVIHVSKEDMERIDNWL